MKTIKNIYNRMNARTLYIMCVAALTGGLTACGNDDDATTTSPTDGENTPISATASMPQAWGSVGRGFV